MPWASLPAKCLTRVETWSATIGTGELWQVLAVLFVATVVRSAFGFGEALVAVPLLAFILPVELASPVVALVSITVALLVVVQDWHKVHVRSAGWLVLSTVLGTPLGLLLLTRVPEPMVKGLLAGLIIAFSTYSLFARLRSTLVDDRYAGLFGFVAGILGGAYGINGPPLVIYGALRGWSPQHFRATLQGYFFPASLLVMGGYWIAGLWTPTVNTYYLASLPVVVPALLIGRYLNHRMHGGYFLRYVHIGLIGIGVLLLVQSCVVR
ncbi:MAG TPA: sulfite exporter TauE/SafE family protein [Planctomycetaceae bacterium]|nr:sulfite exporter TauE/SafE family protein [Planctomycetaceae bacterium]